MVLASGTLVKRLEMSKEQRKTEVGEKDKSNKQQNQAIHFFHWQSKLFHRSNLPQSMDLR